MDLKTAPFPRHPAVIDSLQTRFPPALLVAKLPMAASDRDILAMKIDSSMTELHRLCKLVEGNPEGVKDAFTGTVVPLASMILRIQLEARKVAVLHEYVVLNDAWVAS